MSYLPVPTDDLEASAFKGAAVQLHEADAGNPRRRQSQPRLEQAFRILTLALLSVLCVLAGLNLAVLLRRQQDGAAVTVRREYGSDFKYMSLDHKYDYLWNGDMDARGVIIYLEENPNLAERPEVGSISMFHQLHCLTSFRAALQRAIEGEHIGIDEHDDLHWPHCLHYLRETILCFADATIERGPIVNGTRTRGIDGAHDLRTCGNSQALYELREQSGVLALAGS